MVKLFVRLVLVTLVIGILTTFVVVSAQKEGTSSGKPFEELWDAINAIKDEIVSVWEAITNLNDDLDAETSAREAADNDLQDNIDAEETARIAGDDDLQDQIDTIELTPGPQGEQGDPGIQGLTGDIGSQGEQGIQGDTGDTGAQGQPSDITVLIAKDGNGNLCDRPANLGLEIEGVLASEDLEYIGPIIVDTKVIEYQDGEDIISRKRPGRTVAMSFEVWANVTSDEAMSLFLWRKKIFDGIIERKSGSIIFNDDLGDEVLRYNFFEAWPSKLETPVVDPCTGNIIEKYTIVLEKLERG